MIICRDCGHQNEDEDQFCGSCGAFLEFSGEKVQPAVLNKDDPSEDDEAERFLRLKQATATDAATLATGVAQDERVEQEDAALAAQVAAAKVAAEEQRVRALAEEEAAVRLAEVEKQQREAAEKAEAAERELAELQQSREDEAQRQRQREEAAAAEAQQRLEARVAEAEAKARAQAAEEQRILQAKLEENERAAQAAREEAQASAERAKQAELEAEEQRRAAQIRLEEAAAAASAAALRASQENDALAAAEAARLSSEAEAARSRAEAASVAATAAEEIAKSRAEAEQAKAEAQMLRSQLQADAARSELDLLKERADRSAQEDAARARQRVEDEEASARQRAKDSAEAASMKAAAEAAASERKAEAELAARNAEAKAAAARAEEERARSAAEAETAKRSREEALRKASALVAPAKPVAGTNGVNAQAGAALKPGSKPMVSSTKGTLESTKVQQKVDSIAEGSVAARLPGAQVQRQAPKKSAAAEINPGDVVCGSCGVGNLPTRKFCRRCGTSLVDAKVAKLGFFARLKARRNRKRIKEAGTRPGGPGQSAKGQKTTVGGVVRGAWWKVNTSLMRVGAFLGILAMLGLGVEPIRSKLHLPNVRQSVMDLVKRTITNPPYDPVRAQRATASSGANPSALIDLGNNTTWKAAPTPTGGVGSSFVISFDKPFDVGRVLMTSGLAGSDKPGEGFVSQPRPSELRVIFNDEVAEPLTVKVKDTADPQVLKINHKDVRAVRFEITGVFPSVGGVGKSVAVTEVEFFQKRKLGDDFEVLPKPKISVSGGVGAVSLTDEDLATAWISSTGVGGGQSFSLIFATPVDIDRLRIAPGRSETEFQSSPRPHEVQLAFQCQGRCDATKQISFKDKPGFKTIGVSATGVTRIDVLVRSVYGEGEGVAFAEIDVARKRPKVQ